MARRTGLSRGQLLPPATIVEFRRRLRQVFGLLVGAIALTIGAILFSYHPSDPSFNTASYAPIHNYLSWIGAILADFLLQIFGLAPVTFIFTTLAWGGCLIAEIRIRHILLKIVCASLAVFSFSIFLAFFPNSSNFLLSRTLGGTFGELIYTNFALQRPSHTSLMIAIFSFIAFVINFTLALGLNFDQWRQTVRALSQSIKKVFYAFEWVVGWILKPTYHFLGKPSWILHQEKSTHNQSHGDTKVTPIIYRFEDPITEDYPLKGSLEPESFLHDLKNDDRHEPKPVQKKQTTRALRPVAMPVLSDGDYQLPSLDLLDPATKKNTKVLSEEAIEESAHQLEAVLQEFGVRGEVVAVCPGPVVTLYELKPAAGIKTSRVIGLADDIARSMSALSARIAVIPGRNVIGIELPNPCRETVYLRELLDTEEYQKHPAHLAMILGKDIGGSPIIADLARMPHLLVAGTTGSGKSVSINTMILSLLFRLSPERCKFIMIDPKMLELSVYDDIPHLLTPVVTDPKKAVVALKWAVREMENRYRAMAKLGVRNIDGYNARIVEAQESGELLMRRVQTGFDPDTGKPIFENQSLDVNPLPYIVVVVDEMADLMLVAGKEIEAAVQRLAQMARAAGIHLIMATQRPSVDVITGTIKANFPTRMSFMVTSKIDSRTILGEQGAEQLLGQGDMLYMAGGGRLMRVHGPFVKDEEVERIVHYLKLQGEPTYIEGITDDDQEIFAEGSDEKVGDPIYNQAIDLIRREGKASTSFIQRHLQIGYNRAARIIEQMEKEGLVSPANHVGKREVLM
jgi:S-DNA-T family DNA segregation ATPase FtsK/SpoIIIE